MKKLNPLFIAAVLVVVGVTTSLLAFQDVFSSKCEKDFVPLTFVGKTAMKTIIALRIESVDGEVKGRGFHRFSSGKINNIELSGTIDCETGQIGFSETYLGKDQLFGKISGKLDNLMNLSGVWVNSKMQDQTIVSLDTTSLSPNELLQKLDESESVGYHLGKIFDRFKENKDDFFDSLKEKK